MRQGSFVEARDRPWLAEAVNVSPGAIKTLSLSCVADEARGEALEVIWDADVGASSVLDEAKASPTMAACS